MADDSMDFESFDKLDDLDWSELEEDVKRSSEGEQTEAPAAPQGADANAAPMTSRSDKYIDVNYLLDVNLQVTVEVGRRSSYISQVLGYDHGSVIELDRAVGEPLDLLVNGKRVARGEIVVVNDRFALKIIEILDPNDRMAQLML